MKRSLVVLLIIVCVLAIAALSPQAPSVRADTETDTPTGVTYSQGSTYSGDPTTGTATDDGVYHVVQDSATYDFNYYYTFNGFSGDSETVTQIAIHINAKRTGSGVMNNPEMYVYGSSGWIDMGAFAIGTADTDFDKSYTDQATIDLILGASQRVQFYLYEASNQWNIATDYIYVQYTYSVAPVNVEAECLNLDDTDNIYARYKSYRFNATVTDPNGATEVATVTIGNLLDFQCQYQEATNSFSEWSGGETYSINTSDCSWDKTGNTLKVIFSLVFEWGFTRSNANLSLWTVDDGSHEDTDYYYVGYDWEGRLDFSAGPTLSDGSGTADRGNYNTAAGITASGTVIYYTGTIHPSASIVDVYIVCAEVSGSPWNATNYSNAGTFTRAVDSDDVVGLDTYTFKVVQQGAGAGGTDLCYTTKTDTYIADHVTVTLSITYSKIGVGQNASGLLKPAVYDYGGSFDGTVNLNSTTFSYTTAGYHGYTTSSISGGTHGVTSFTSNSLTVLWQNVTCTTPLTVQWLEVSETNWWAQVHVLNIQWSVEGTDVPDYSEIKLYVNDSLKDTQLVDSGDALDLMVQFNSATWHYAEFQVYINYITAPYYFPTFCFYSQIEEVPIVHTLYIEVWDIDFTDAYIYITFGSNWHNSTLTIWDDAVLVDYFESEGVCQFAVPTLAGTHVIDLLVNGSYPKSQGTYNAAFPDDDAWEWRHFNFMVSVAYGDLFVYFYNQHGDNIPFDTFRVYLNGTRHYSFQTTWDISKKVNVTVVDRFGTTLKTQTYSYTVAIEIELTLYSLKVMSYHEGFVWFNVTKAGTGQYWSSYLAPLEVMNFELYAGSYTIYVNYLNGTVVSQGFALPAAVYSDYAFLITEDTVHDILYFWSQTYQTTYTINVTLTSTSQTVTTINLNLVNVNSTIQSQLIEILVDIENTNSTVFDQTVAILADISNVNSTLFAQTVTLLANLASHNTTIYNQVLSLAADVANVNSTLYTQTLEVLADIANVNSTLYSQLVTVLTDIASSNSTIYGQTVTLLTNLQNVNSTLFAQTVNVLDVCTRINGTLYAGNGLYLVVWDYDVTETQVVASILTNYANATVSYYHNGTFEGSATEGLDLAWAKDLSYGYHRVAFLVDAGVASIWLNRSYTIVSDPSLALTVWNFQQDDWYIHLTVATNWANTSVTVIDSYWDGTQWQNRTKYAGVAEGTFDWDVSKDPGNHTVYVTLDGGADSISRTVSFLWKRDYPQYEPPVTIDYRWLLGFVLLLGVGSLAMIGATFRRSGRGLPATTYTPPTSQPQRAMTPEERADYLTSQADEPAKQRVWEEYLVECHERGEQPKKTREQVWKEYQRGDRR
jgi:hypothetical protein